MPSFRHLHQSDRLTAKGFADKAQAPLPSDFTVASDSSQRPMLLIDRTLGDPSAKQLLLRRGENFVGIGRGHQVVRVRRENALDQFALVRFSRDERLFGQRFFAHVQAHPRFTACIDAWWTEPVRHGRFDMGHRFLDLPNVIGSPHNSAGGGVWRDVSLRRAVANCRRALEGETPLHLIGPEERMI